MNKPELLSPAGNLEKLKLALHYGADAVYGGVSNFSLRIRSSREFNYESFKEGVDYTHNLDKKIYVTINGFPQNSQIPRLEEHILKMAEMNPDGFIIATPGVIKLAKKLAPQIPLHLSTQANVLNYLDAEIYYEMGVSRIVAARELSLKDLELIKQKLPNLELEAFIHGSMCYAYSGRCLISSVQSGRVPNRGSCANDCRFPYTLYAKNEDSGTLFKIDQQEEGTYILNAKDLNLSTHLDKILSKNIISSLKIEGRTKSAYYVSIVTKTYRNAIDDFYNGKFNVTEYEKELNSTTNRGFSDGYLVKRPFQRSDTQNLLKPTEVATHQVFAQISESGLSFKAKDKVEKGVQYEVVTPVLSSDFALEENEIGSVFQDEFGNIKLVLKSIETADGKILDEIHSGNLNEVLLPCKLPPFSFLRKEI